MNKIKEFEKCKNQIANEISRINKIIELHILENKDVNKFAQDFQKFQLHTNTCNSDNEKVE